MAPTLLYLLRANAMLVLFAAAYYGLLRRLTFFTLNRAYLLGALAFAAVYPVLPVPALLPAAAALLPASLAAVAGPAAGPAAGSGAAPTPGFDWQAAAVWVYAAGTGGLVLRLLGQLLSLALVHRRSRPAVVLGQAVRVLAGAGGPFSFGRAIYLSESALADPAALPPALRHEQAHVRQWHTLDVLLLQLATALAWLNPAAWLLRRAALDNLEYLADRAALRAGLDRRAYQYSLLHQSPGGVPVPALAFHFSFLTLRSRIVMLNQPLSSTRQLGRYLLAAPLVVLLALGYAGARAQTAPIWHNPMAIPVGIPVYLDGQLSTSVVVEKLDTSAVASMNVLQGVAARLFNHNKQSHAIILITKANQRSAAVRTLAKTEQQATAAVVKIQESDLPAPVQAYLKHGYADYRMIELGRVAPTSGEPLRYQAIMAKGRRPAYLLFDAKGDFLESL